MKNEPKIRKKHAGTDLKSIFTTNNIQKIEKETLRMGKKNCFSNQDTHKKFTSNCYRKLTHLYIKTTHTQKKKSDKKGPKIKIHIPFKKAYTVPFRSREVAQHH